jgi:hypothetical protein
MQTLTLAQAQHAIALQQNNNTLTVAQLQQLLQNVSVTFAQLLYVTDVTLAAAHKAQSIKKVTSANVMLASTLHASTQLYARAVRKSALRISNNDVAAVQHFEAQQNYFEHTATHCIVAHKQRANAFYLYAIYNNASSVYVHNNALVDKHHVAQYCTPSAARNLLLASNVVHNVTHNIAHTVQVRTVALANIVQVRARKQLLTV